ncbi:hypothetical protein ACVS4I_003105 [Vibrio fluvialis]
MTAEVAVYNRSTIALAADSASTISNGRTQKIYNNAEKLFALTKHYPVGIMVYGAGELLDIPWELIIKSYRKKLKGECFNTLQEYVDSFFDFIPEFFSKIPLNVVKVFLQSTIMNYYEYVEEKANIETSHTLEEKISLLTDAMQDEVEILSDEDSCYLAGFSFKDQKLIRESIKPIINDVVNGLELNEVSKSTINSFKRVFTKLSVLALCKSNHLDTDLSGLVFAGYGEQEYLPQILTYEVNGMVVDKLRFDKLNHKCSSHGEIAIIPFAQQTEVQTFIAGVSNHIRKLYTEMSNVLCQTALIELVEILEDIPGLEDGIKQQKIKSMSGRLSDMFDEKTTFINEYIKDNHVDKIVLMLQHLPKNELAYMAESLVNLTAFKRKVSNETDTVGGPIDVAVISKGDGFVWVKRKHYFPGELNQDRYLQNCD